ncbi:MAG: hypothetical protein IJE49_11280 [Agathobacter sp.]|nr:hypothetical protein [Agathobacter sp.]
MKRKLILVFVLCMCFLVGCGGNDDEKDKGKNTETKQESEVDTEAEKIANMTEEEYKAYCEVMYNKEIFERDDIEGKHIKIYGFIAGKYRYTDSSTFGMVINDLTKKYDLDTKYLDLGVAHEGKGSYAGDGVYLLFDNEGDLSIDDYESGLEIIVYGEVVQCWNGPFVIPKYIEISEIAFPHLEMK